MSQFQELDVDDVLTCLKTAINLAETEEDLRVRSSNCIEEKILKPLGIAQIGKYEYTFVSGGRADALYGHVIIEYKAPGKLSNRRDIAKAKEQVVRYIIKEAEVEARYKNFLGIIISDRIAFVRYDPLTKQWLLRGPYDINRETVIKLIEALRGLRRKKLGVDELLTDFGKNPKTKTMSPLAQKAVKVLYKKLVNSEKPRVKILFEDWKRLFSQATGYSPSKLKGLEKEYGLNAKKIDYDALLFAIHTYYALIMKLLAAEIAYLYGTGRWLKSYVAELDDAYMRGLEEFRRVLEELESGGVFRKLLGITNFIEGDYFSWYLNELDKELADVIAEIARRLSDYEPATPQLEPEFTRDLLKRLYQHLVPETIRHDLGEYYTPDWLAELVLNEVGFAEEYFEKLAKKENDPTAPFNLRLLDPACGSGTFLILAIKRLRSYAEKHYMLEIVADYILNNIVGYDLNPLAVLTARTNYLLAIADIISRVKGEKEIPVYLADSVLVETKGGLYGVFYVLRTVVGNFEMPKQIVDEGLLGEFLNLIETSIRNQYKPQEFLELFRNKIVSKLKNNTIDYNAIRKLYETFLQLEKEGKNHVWASIIRNAFAPLLKGKFDFVVGNPPWVKWDSLPSEYRESTRDLWSKYGLIAKGAGRFKRDLAMLFLVRSFDLYLKDDGMFGFLIPLTVFKTLAGAGFRNYIARWEIIRIHDLVTLYPFEGATNRTAAIIIRKVPRSSKEHEFNHVVWINLSNKPVPIDATINEVLAITERHEIKMIPLQKTNPFSPWAQVSKDAYDAMKKVLGKSLYKAHEGVITALNQVYYIDVIDRLPDGTLLITNPERPGQKKRVKVVEAKVEPELVYPLVRGRDVKKWYVDYEYGYILMPHDPVTGKPYPILIMKTRYPNAFEYLMIFKDELKRRTIKPFISIHKQMEKLEKEIRKLKRRGVPEQVIAAYLKKLRSLDEALDEQFYILDNVGDYTFKPYKVVWKYVAGAITGKAEFACAVLRPVQDKYVGMKPLIPNEKLMLVAFEDEDEAYYLAGVLNSSFIRAIAASYMVETEISTHLLENVRVPKYDSNNKLHRYIAELSKRAHELTREIIENGRKDLEEELRKVELEIDKLVAKLYGIPERGVRAVRKLLHILLGEEYEEEEEEVAETSEAKPSVQFLHTVVKANTEDYFELYVVNPSGYRVEVTIDAPWGKEGFEVAEKEKRVRIKVPPLMPGKYTVKYIVRYNDVREEGEFTVETEFRGPRRITRGLADLV